MSGADPVVLVFHGITMSGASMLRGLGPLGQVLRERGLRLIAPDGGAAQRPEVARRTLDWASPRYEALGQRADAAFAEGAFWLDGQHFDWFDGVTDPSGRKVYRALPASLRAVERAAEGQRVVGVLGFSQGAAMAALVAGLARRGALSWGDDLQFGLFLSGFLPVFDEPALAPWPVPGLAAWLATGDQDPIFPERATLEQLGSVFEAPELCWVPGLGHEVVSDEAAMQRVRAFLGRCGL